MTRTTPTSADLIWSVTSDGVIIKNGERVVFRIPVSDFPVLILNMVKVMKEHTKPID